MEAHWKIFLLLVAFAEVVSSAKILALMVVASHSHHLWNTKYLEALIDRGHHVTYFAVDDYKNPPQNLSQILVKDLYQGVFGDIDLSSLSDEGSYRNVLFLELWDKLETEFIAKSEGLKQLNRLIRKEKFDLVVHDVASCLFLLGAVDVLGRVPVIGITPFSVPTWTLDILGNPMVYSTKPYFYMPYSDDMTFFQRANNYFLHLFSFAVRWFFMRGHNEISKKVFGNDVRSLNEIMDDINIIMVNENLGLDYVFPKVPGLIPVGGLHIEEPKPLPPELKTFLDEAKDGAVYFSLGSNIKSSLTKEKIDVLTKAFKQLSPVRVLWKLDPNVLQEKPKNVKTEPWLRQNDVLAHPNVRLFFTHSGLLSTQEAVYHGKPMVGMPFFLDQSCNLGKSMDKGIAEKLDYNGLTSEKIVSTIRKVLNDPRYTEKAKKASAIFRDEMENPRDRAVYWTEYAIRHKGAPHLRHSARNLSWYQNWMLDVILTSIAIVSSILFFVYKLITTITSWMRRDAGSKLKTN